MKRLLLLFVIACTLVACNETEEIDYAQEILGRWECDYIDGRALPTQAFHIIHFQNSNKLVWSQGCTAENGTDCYSWHNHPGYSYRVTENIITYEGTDSHNNQIYAELAINSVTENSLTYYIQKQTINNVTVTDNRLYKLKRINDENPQLEGIWTGREVSTGTQTHDYYWQFFNDGRFDFYYYDEASGKYKNGNVNGRYDHYSDILILHSNATLIEGDYTYDAWHIAGQTNESMDWICKTDAGTNISFMLTRVAELPEME